MKRECKIIAASIEDADGGGDGAYDLLDVNGSPEEVGQKITESLLACDIYQGRTLLFADRGQDLFLNVRIRISPDHVPLTVYDSFAEAFGAEPGVEWLRDIPLDSVVGKAAQEAIAAALVLRDKLDMHPLVRNPLAAALTAHIGILYKD